MNVFVTGANGFIGRALCRRLASDNKVVGVDITGPPDGALNVAWEQVDLTDAGSVTAICERYSPDVVIHCAGIAHQKIGAVDSATYMRVNSEVTENFAKAAAESNPDVLFIFLSSVSVYGEENITIPASEDSECHPSSDYAVSKLDAERRLIALSDDGIIHNLIILRLAPVYDREWSLNLDRRVFAPKKLAYLRFGSGTQRMSALARPNLVDFIEFLLQRQPKNSGINILNIADAEAYEFNKIIRVFQKSGIRPNRLIISIPLSPVWLATRIAGILLPGKRNWLHSCYDKLASDLVFDNGKMMKTGFKPHHSLETVFAH
jgi:nucleoside-diphosphate-sugar epimerase